MNVDELSAGMPDPHSQRGNHDRGGNDAGDEDPHGNRTPHDQDEPGEYERQAPDPDELIGELFGTSVT